MNAVESAFKNAQRTPGKSFDVRLGIYKLSFKDGELEVLKPNGEDFSNDEVNEVRAEVVGFTKRKWARIVKNNEDHHARFVLVPEQKPIKGSSANPDGMVFPAGDGVSVATIQCHHRDSGECSVELLMDGEHYGSPVKYGYCLDCGRCFVSIQKRP